MTGVVFCRFARQDDRIVQDAHVAQLVEHVLGKDEVISSILIMGSRELFVATTATLTTTTQENGKRAISTNETAR